MPGLLDNIDTLAFAQGLLSTRRPMEGLLQGLLLSDQRAAAAKQAKAAEEERALRRQMAELQLQQAQQQQAKAQAIDAAYKGAIRTPEQMAMGANGGPTIAAAQAAPGMAPGIDQNALIRGLMNGGAAQEAFQMLQPKPDELMALNPGQIVFNKSKGTEAFRAPDKPEALPGSVREFQFAQMNPAFAAYQERLKRAGATNVSVSNAEKPLVNTIATGLGKQLDDGLSAARAASTAISNAQTLRKAAESGNLIAGPTASIRIPLLQVGQMLGVGGKDDAERLANTRQAVQTMAQAELDAAQQMKGQGQITEAERDIIRRAAAGDINSFTAPEISQLSQAIEKTARAKIASHRRSVGALQNIKGAESLIPFYQVDEPAPYAAPNSGGGWSIRPIGGN